MSRTHISLTDPVDNTTRWVYDDRNRLIEAANQLDDARYFEYDRTRRIAENRGRLLLYTICSGKV